jgi:hypothetical protein
MKEESASAGGTKKRRHEPFCPTSHLYTKVKTFGECFDLQLEH